MTERTITLTEQQLEDIMTKYAKHKKSKENKTKEKKPKVNKTKEKIKVSDVEPTTNNSYKKKKALVELCKKNGVETKTKRECYITKSMKDLEDELIYLGIY